MMFKIFSNYDNDMQGPGDNVIEYDGHEDVHTVNNKVYWFPCNHNDPKYLTQMNPKQINYY